ncbi:hypothetical protein CEUSTIGMA_g2948.t1 [Chlamydomonas eustigma]|uniref:YdbS-like PH domain-containing protein n=1 Tax=Chlamydomonas eustigma TaxID=1157962 RepID=A0A250WXJ1_9CHLO|nr:hypothetical protein CEUSTIGMA_g2948.t1 [Chlamydomonas eustigma]|eukprot:GAX75505.1 hypothetical protein CEUSTIGMA_g2948.t1 [Chlamydomonas eustigma]
MINHARVRNCGFKIGLPTSTFVKFSYKPQQTKISKSNVHREAPTFLKCLQVEPESSTEKTNEPSVPSSSRAELEETVFMEGHLGSNVELLISMALTATLIFAPLTIASLGRRLWLNYKFTNKRVVISNTSPLFKREIQIAYSEIREVRTAPRALGTWGDMVLFTKRGERIELIGMEKYQDIKYHIDKCLYTI